MMKYHAHYETAEGYTGPAVSDCWIVLDSCGLWLHYDEGGCIGVKAVRIAESDIIDGMHYAGIDEPDDEPDSGTWDVDDSTMAALFESLNCDRGRRYEWFDAVLKTAAVPCCDPTDADGPFAAHNWRMRENMLHDPNFHSGLEGATMRERVQIASDMCGVSLDDSLDDA